MDREIALTETEALEAALAACGIAAEQVHKPAPRLLEKIVAIATGEHRLARREEILEAHPEFRNSIGHHLRCLEADGLILRPRKGHYLPTPKGIAEAKR